MYNKLANVELTVVSGIGITWVCDLFNIYAVTLLVFIRFK